MRSLICNMLVFFLTLFMVIDVCAMARPKSPVVQRALESNQTEKVFWADLLESDSEEGDNSCSCDFENQSFKYEFLPDLIEQLKESCSPASSLSSSPEEEFFEKLSPQNSLREVVLAEQRDVRVVLKDRFLRIFAAQALIHEGCLFGATHGAICAGNRHVVVACSSPYAALSFLCFDLKSDPPGKVALRPIDCFQDSSGPLIEPTQIKALFYLPDGTVCVDVAACTVAPDYADLSGLR